MKRIAKHPKVSLSRETVRALSTESLAHVAGGSNGPNSSINAHGKYADCDPPLPPANQLPPVADPS